MIATGESQARSQRLTRTTVADCEIRRPAFERVLRLAQAVTASPIAQIEIHTQAEPWRMAIHPAAARGLRRLETPAGEPVWIADLAGEGRFDGVEAISAFGARFYAAAPLLLEEGAEIGVLFCIDARPHPIDSAAASRLADLADLAAREWRRPPPAEPEPAPVLRVLLAEDHPTNRKMVEVILETIGVEVTSVETGQAALDSFCVEAFDLVLMDLQMPVMDGLTAIRTMRAVEAERRGPRTPIYALTASAMADHIEASRMAGADAHLTKPITPAHLIAAVRGASQAGDPAAFAPPRRQA